MTALGVQVWLPEAGGPVELDSPVHQALMVLLGAQAQREVARARQRVVAAMRVQTVQGPVPGWPSTVWISPGGWWVGRTQTECMRGGGGGFMCWSLIR